MIISNICKGPNEKIQYSKGLNPHHSTFQWWIAPPKKVNETLSPIKAEDISLFVILPYKAGRSKNDFRKSSIALSQISEMSNNCSRIYFYRLQTLIWVSRKMRKSMLYEIRTTEELAYGNTNDSR